MITAKQIKEALDYLGWNWQLSSSTADYVEFKSHTGAYLNTDFETLKALRDLFNSKDINWHGPYLGIRVTK
jgi:hypothetical protein